MHKIYTALIAIALGAGIYIGKSQFSKTVEVEKEVTRTDVVTVVREVVKPDGTKETTSTTTDHSISKRDSTSTTSLAPRQPDWHVSVSYSKTFSDPAPVYGLQVERRILGPFSLGVRADTEKTIGIVIGMEF